MEAHHFNSLYEALDRRHSRQQIKGKKGWDAYHLIKEALITGLFMPLVSEYLGKGKAVDAELLEKAHRIYEESGIRIR
ncbi:MAG: hypothetical protein AB1331_02500 [Bacillota bacterium]